MRAIVVPRLGGPEVLTLREVPQPTPAAGEVLVKIKYAGITFGDVYQREGTYRAGKPLLETDQPLPIGGEGAGTVAAVGPGVTPCRGRRYGRLCRDARQLRGVCVGGRHGA